MVQKGCICGSGDLPTNCCNMVSLYDVLEIIDGIEELEGEMPDSTYEVLLRVAARKEALEQFLRENIRMVKTEIRNEVLALNS